MAHEKAQGWTQFRPTLRKTIYIYICDIDIENIDSSHHTIHLVCV